MPVSFIMAVWGFLDNLVAWLLGNEKKISKDIPRPLWGRDIKELKSLFSIWEVLIMTDINVMAYLQ